MGLCQIYSEVMFGPSLDKFECQRSRSPGQKNWHFSALPAVCVRFMFGIISLASSSFFHHKTVFVTSMAMDMCCEMQWNLDTCVFEFVWLRLGSNLVLVLVYQVAMMSLH